MHDFDAVSLRLASRRGDTDGKTRATRATRTTRKVADPAGLGGKNRQPGDTKSFLKNHRRMLNHMIMPFTYVVLRESSSS